MNGATRFVFRLPGGSVISESSLKEMRKAEGEKVDTRVDPVTGLRDPEDAPEEEYITINPREEEAERMKDAWTARVTQEKELKKLAKEKKRKSHTTEEMPPPSLKKSKKSKSSLVLPPAPSGPTPANTIPLLSATLSAKIAAEKTKFSPAVASLYAPKGGDANHDSDGRSNWMTRSTFVRGSFS